MSSVSVALLSVHSPHYPLFVLFILQSVYWSVYFQSLALIQHQHGWQPSVLFTLLPCLLPANLLVNYRNAGSHSVWSHHNRLCLLSVGKADSNELIKQLACEPVSQLDSHGNRWDWEHIPKHMWCRYLAVNQAGHFQGRWVASVKLLRQLNS